MSAAPDRPRRRARPVLGHPGRMERGAVEFASIFVAYFAIMLGLLFQDELAVELAEAGLIRENMRESAELAIGLVLILCWSALTVILIRLINAIKASAHSTRKGDDG
ncbi:hypothetical protein [Pseudooceanicola sp.]|uniref:hypothetical protein n=1 Tax=Pseudooceanicola sp. TaxID=1914328 RepID=UPI003511996A